MLIGTGVDIVEVERVERSIARYGDRFLRRVFTPGEIAYCSQRRAATESFAARFAAKEAGAKALGTGIQHGIGWTEIEVRRLPGQRPTLHFSGRALEWATRLKAAQISLSISHTRGLAIATVQLEGYECDDQR